LHGNEDQDVFTPTSDVPAAFRIAFERRDLDPSLPTTNPQIEENRLRHGLSFGQTLGSSHRETSVVMPEVERKPLLFRITLDCIDGDHFVFDYVELRPVREDQEKIIYSNAAQPIPTKFTVTFNINEKTFHITLKQENRPLNAYQFLKLLRLETCLSKPLVLRIVDLEAGFVAFESDQLGSERLAPDPEFVQLIADLAAIQAIVRRPIPISPGRILKEDEQVTIGKLRTILHEGGFTAALNELHFDFKGTPEDARANLEIFGEGRTGWIRWIGEETEKLFGVELPLGKVQYTCRATLANEQDVRQKLAQDTAATQIELRLVPAEDRTLIVEYLDWQPQDRTAQPSVEFKMGLSDAQVAQLYAMAAQLGLAPDVLVRMALSDFLDVPALTFEEAAKYLLEKNAELYRRLA
jgi:hypothetical protein